MRNTFFLSNPTESPTFQSQRKPLPKNGALNSNSTSAGHHRRPALQQDAFMSSWKPVRMSQLPSDLRYARKRLYLGQHLLQVIIDVERLEQDGLVVPCRLDERLHFSLGPHHLGHQGLGQLVLERDTNLSTSAHTGHSRHEIETTVFPSIRTFCASALDQPTGCLAAFKLLLSYHDRCH